MKDLKYYEEKNKAELEKRILEDLKNSPVQITVDCKIEKPEDLEKSSNQFSIRKTWRTLAKAEFEKAKEPTHRFIMINQEGLKLNGVDVEKGIVLPIYAPQILDDSEITTNMLCHGLLLSLKAKYDEYYHQLLNSFNLDPLSLNLRKEVEKYLEDNKIST